MADMGTKEAAEKMGSTTTKSHGMVQEDKRPSKNAG